MNRYMTLNEVAAYFGKNPMTVHRMIRLGRIQPSLRQGRRLLFLSGKIERLSWQSLFRLPKHRKIRLPDGYLTQSQVARLFGKSPNIVSELVGRGDLVPDLIRNKRRLFRAERMATLRLESLYRKAGGLPKGVRTVPMTLGKVPPITDEECADLRGYILKTITHDELMERLGCRTRQRLSQRMQMLAYRKVVHQIVAEKK